MTIFLIKSLLSLLLLFGVAVSAYAMLEACGRGAAVASAERFKRIHRVAGYSSLLLFALLAYLCIGFAAAAKTEPSPRAALHSALAYSVIALFVLKLLFLRVYRQFNVQARIFGIVISVAIFVLVGVSAGHYLTVSGLGRDLTTDKSAYFELRGPLLRVVRTAIPPPAGIRTDSLSIARGRTMFLARCAGCHDALSANMIVGPGLKGLFKNAALPVSRHPATAESVRFQLRQAMRGMPSFDYLTEEEMSDLIAYLNTL